MFQLAVAHSVGLPNHSPPILGLTPQTLGFRPLRGLTIRRLKITI